MLTVIDPGSGLWWNLHDPGQHIGRIIRESGQPYELGVLERMAAEYRERDTSDDPAFVLDVGAHVGNHSLYMAAVCSAPVLAFEPSPVNYAGLVANLAANPALSDLVYPLEMALGAVEGRSSFEGAPADDITWGKAPALPVLDGPIERDTIDRVVAALDSDDQIGTAVSVIKVDVEGQEPSVMLGAEVTLARWGPAVFLESQDAAAALKNSVVMHGFDYRLAEVLNRRRTPVELWLPA